MSRDPLLRLPDERAKLPTLFVLPMRSTVPPMMLRLLPASPRARELPTKSVPLPTFNVPVTELVPKRVMLPALLTVLRKVIWALPPMAPARVML